jgi:hypothetical protein
MLRTPTSRPLLLVLLILAIWGPGCGAPEGVGGSTPGSRSVSSGSCDRLARLTPDELISIQNTAYFEASYLSKEERQRECALVTGTIIGRALEAGWYGQGVNAVISAPNQFEPYEAIRLIKQGVSYTLIDGVSVLEADAIRRQRRNEGATTSSTADHRQGDLDCAEAVEQTLRDTPGSVFLNFHSGGRGTNLFENPAFYPDGCNLLDEVTPPRTDPPLALTPLLGGIVTLDGRALAGITVVAYGSAERDLKGEILERQQATTDASGRYALQVGNPRLLYAVLANADYAGQDPLDGILGILDDRHGAAVIFNVELVPGADGWHVQDFALDR